MRSRMRASVPCTGSTPSKRPSEICGQSATLEPGAEALHDRGQLQPDIRAATTTEHLHGGVLGVVASRSAKHGGQDTAVDLLELVHHGATAIGFAVERCQAGMQSFGAYALVVVMEAQVEL